MSKFFFAWATADDTTFGGGFQVEDEDVFSFVLEHKEGEVPTLTVDIPNPRVGLLGAGRKTWCWFSWQDTEGQAGAAGTVYPLFYGRLVGTPDNILGEDITLNFVGRPLNYRAEKQRVAETLKDFPYYDPLWIAVEKRDDPDTIIQARSAFWHVDRVTMNVNLSDALVGEDGTEVFTADEVPYDSVSMRIGQPPIRQVRVVGDVSWQQAYSGYVNIGNYAFTTYSGDGILSDWPKPLTDLGGGWSAAYSVAIDVFRVGGAQTSSRSYNWNNTARTHTNGDTMSISYSASSPNLPNGALSWDTSVILQNGVIDPFATDSQGDPAPLNIPEVAQIQSVYVPIWQVNTSLVAAYKADRQLVEKCHVTVTSDVQAIITDDGDVSDVKTITVSGGGVDQPILNVLNWSTLAGQAVGLGQIIFPDTNISGNTAQVAVTAGTAGTTPPTFSDVAGATTTDGSVVWASLGSSSSLAAAPDWKANSVTTLGTIVLPRRVSSIPYDWLVAQGLADFPQTGVNVNLNTVVSKDGTYYVCSQSGTSDPAGPVWSPTAGTTTADGDAIWTSLGPTLPDGATYFLATTGGVSGVTVPPFAPTVGTTTADNTVTWTSLGTADVPIGSTARGNFFPSDRGVLSIGYLVCLGRAELRVSARCVEVSWECDLARAINLSCRLNATIEDTRLPGGSVTGKVTAYTMQLDGDKGDLFGTVTIGCAVGNGGTITTTDGTPDYVETEAVASGYQYTGGTIVPVDDVGFTPPAAGANPDDIQFPLSRAAAVKYEMIHGDIATQSAAFAGTLYAGGSAGLSQDYLGNDADQRANERGADNYVRNVLKQVPIWLELELLNLTGGPFQFDYFVTTTPLVIPQSINLSSA
jgi:hypothetical protein